MKLRTCVVQLITCLFMKKFLYKDLYELEKSHWWHKAKRLIVSEYINKYFKSNNLRILDVGCGTGENIDFFSEKGQVYGIDNSKDAIAYCRSRGIKKIKLASAYQTGYPNNSFDVIFLLDVLEHVDEKKILEELSRILMVNGKIFITVPAYMFLWSNWDKIHHHKRRYTINNLKKVLKTNRFTINKISYMYSFVILPLLLVRIIKSKIMKNSYTSDFKINTRMLNGLLLAIVAIERVLIRYNLIKFGTSIFCVATRNE